MKQMDMKNCSESRSFSETNSSDIVLEAGNKGHTSNISTHASSHNEDINSRMAKDGVGCSNISTHASHNEDINSRMAKDGVGCSNISTHVSHNEDINSRMAKDGVGCSNISTHASHNEAVADNSTVVSCHKGNNDTSKEKAKEHHIVDLSGGGESDNDQRICRICHSGYDQSPAHDIVSGKSVTPGLIDIGCKCKNELGLAHSHCAEAWFELRGNRVCEICGSTAKNVKVRLMDEEEHNVEGETTLDERRVPSCFIFMVFLLVILLFQWFYVNMVSYDYNKDT